jgi:pantoate--beta-alanine ligase
MSSRNRYLNPDQRAVAPALYRSLRAVFDVAATLNMEKTRASLEQQKLQLAENGFKIDYLELVEYASLQPAVFLRAHSRFIVAGAVFIGKTRLIDNLILET